jgi:K(+)-stimulated pyrophosphate-energized sodium pump
MSDLTYYAVFSSVGFLGLTVVGCLFAVIYRTEVNDERARFIADTIANGAMTFLREEYKIIGLAVVIIALILALTLQSLVVPVVFALGALCSMLTGFLGMCAAVAANVRTTLSAKNEGEHAAFLVSFFGGGVMGFSVAAFGLIGVSTVVLLFAKHTLFLMILTSFSLGASLVAFFARIGGGIFTKSADVGADLVGKIEAGIPEDDPRNPAVIADNVGDCVGDTAGMGADIYESYVGALVSSIILATNTPQYSTMVYMTMPLVLATLGLLGSLIGLVSNLLLKMEPAAMLRNATYVAIGSFLLLSLAYLKFMVLGVGLFVVIALGCVSGIIVGLVTEYYTSNTPIFQVAKSSQSGAATNLIYGLSIGMESTIIPVIILSLIVLVAYNVSGLFGLSLAAVSMLATVAITMTVDAYGPIADNAGGIAQMAGFGSSVRVITDKLDALGNTTAAIGKGFAIGSALLTALAILSAYTQEAGLLVLNVLDPYVMVGMFIGATIPFIVSALTMRSVGDAALQMVLEVRRQFKEIPGLMEGAGLPDYNRCIAISTRASLQEMILPSVITIAIPVAVLLFLQKAALGGMLVGSTLTGVMLALMMVNSGGIWDNAKKYIESGHFGGKGSDAHRAAVIGDTVGDPFKDTSGPALNILIKLTSMVSLLLVLIFK